MKTATAAAARNAPEVAPGIYGLSLLNTTIGVGGQPPGLDPFGGHRRGLFVQAHRARTSDVPQAGAGSWIGDGESGDESVGSCSAVAVEATLPPRASAATS